MKQLPCWTEKATSYLFCSIYFRGNNLTTWLISHLYIRWLAKQQTLATWNLEHPFSTMYHMVHSYVCCACNNNDENSKQVTGTGKRSNHSLLENKHLFLTFKIQENLACFNAQLKNLTCMPAPILPHLHSHTEHNWSCQYWGHLKKNVWLYWDVIYIPQNSSKPNDVITSVLTRGKMRWYYVKEETMWQKQRLGCWLPLKAGKGKEIDFPLRRTRPSWHLLLGRWNWFQISDLQECKRINLCCFKLLNVWWSVTEAMGNTIVISWKIS